MQYSALPKWLAESIAHNSFAWNEAATTTFPQLLQHITLHDSIWNYTLIHEEYSLLLFIQLDSFWNKDFCHQLEDWPFLVIKINKPLSNFYDFAEKENAVNIISHAESNSILYSKLSAWLTVGKELEIIPVEFYQQLKNSTIYRTEISTMGGAFSCTHLEDINVLLYTVEGRPLSVNLSGKGISSSEHKMILKQKEPGILPRLFLWLKSF
jgi:hypothetical protein